MIVVTAFIAVVVTALIFVAIRRARYVALFKNIPGPPAYPLVGSILRFITMNHEDRGRAFLDMCQTYEGLMLFWLGPRPTVFIFRPDYIEQLLTSTVNIQKEYYYSFLEPWLGLGLLISSGDRWKKHRKLITPAFHFKILESFLDTFIEQSNILVSLLGKHVDGNMFDMQPYINNCTLDIICETAMGTSVKAQLDGESEYVKSVHKISRMFIQRILHPWLHNDFIFKHSSLGKEFYRTVNVLHGFTRKVIQERKAQKERLAKQQHESDSDENVYYRKRKLAFLDLLIETSENGKYLSDEDLRQEVDTFMFEGHDTTSAALVWTLLLLGEHIPFQDKVYNELQEIFGGSTRNLKVQDLQKMNYLDMVIKESLRLFPSVSILGRTLSEDLIVGNHTIPAGVGVNISLGNIHRNEKIFPNCMEFNPDHFLPENVQGRHPFAYIPFSGGLRNCIGQKFAFMELKVILSSILRYFRIETDERLKTLKVVPDIIIRPENGLQVKITRR